MENATTIFKQLKEDYYSLEEQAPPKPGTPKPNPGNQPAAQAPPAGADPTAMQDTAAGRVDPYAMAGAGGDMGMGAAGGMGGGMGAPEQDDVVKMADSPRNIGRLYELNKIYFNLKTLDNFLLRLHDTEIVKLRELVDEAIDIFKIIVDNLQLYKEKIDNVIVLYYKFIKRLMLIIEKYYKHIYYKEKKEEAKKKAAYTEDDKEKEKDEDYKNEKQVGTLPQGYNAGALKELDRPKG